MRGASPTISVDVRRGFERGLEVNAEEWLAWARTPGHDAAFWDMNPPAFCELIPAPGLRTVDVGCGEGRVGRMLAELGHRVRGVDSSPTLVDAATGCRRLRRGRLRRRGSAAVVPNSYDVAVVFMCLMDMPDSAAAVREIARVLVPGGCLCIALTHPLNGTAEFLDDYFTERVFDERVEADGLSMRFVGRERPIGHYTRVLADSGFVIEELRGPYPSAEAVARTPRLAAATKRPWTLRSALGCFERVLRSMLTKQGGGWFGYGCAPVLSTRCRAWNYVRVRARRVAAGERVRSGFLGEVGLPPLGLHAT